VFGRHRPATNSKYSSSSGTPRPTSGPRATPPELTRHGSTTAMRAPHLHGRRATTARRNVQEDHPHIKQKSKFDEPVSVPRRQGDHFAERGLEASPPPGAAQLRQEVARKGGPRFRHQEWTVLVGWLRPTLKTCPSPK